MCCPCPTKDEIWTLGTLVVNVEQFVIIAATAVLCVLLFLLFRTASSASPCRRLRRTSWPPTTWDSGAAAQRPGMGPGRRRRGHCRTAAGTHHLRARQYGLHRAQGVSGRRGGGFSSLPGAIVGGLVIGLVESFSGFYLPDGFRDVAAYVVVLIMLMVKPNGLFGEKLRKKV